MLVACAARIRVRVLDLIAKAKDASPFNTGWQCRDHHAVQRHELVCPSGGDG
jgi:hypothetical protein